MGIGVKTFEIQSGFSIDSVPPEIAELISRMERYTLFCINKFILSKYGISLGSLDEIELVKSTRNIKFDDLMRVLEEVNILKLSVSELAAAYKEYVEAYGSDAVLREELSKIPDPDEKLYKLMEMLGFEVIRLSKPFAEELRSQGLDPVTLPIGHRRAMKKAEDAAMENIRRWLAESGINVEVNSFDDVEKVIGQLPQDLADKVARYMEFVAELTVKGTIVLKAVLTAI